MKKYIKIFLLVVLAGVFLAGCATNTLKIKGEETVKHENKGFSLLSIILPSASNPVELARAYEITKAADTDAKQAALAQERVTQLTAQVPAAQIPNTPTEDKFAIGIQNQGKKSIFCYHPETGEKQITGRSGGMDVIYVRAIPESLTFYEAGTEKKLRTFGGLKTMAETKKPFGTGWVDVKITYHPKR